MKQTLTRLKLLIILFFATAGHAQINSPSEPIEIYRSDKLVLTRISANAFIHTSFKQTNDFGNVPCNGLVVRDSNEVIIFDTPVSDSVSIELMEWITKELKCKIVAIIPTHFHDDCLGGLKAFDEQQIPSYASSKTIELAKANQYTVPKNGFDDSLELKLGNKTVIALFPGEGHTRDNVVCYFPSENILFGGCLIKALGAGKGYLGDANLEAWSATVAEVKKRFPDVQVVVPGHGRHGDKQLLEYTITMFR